MALKGLPQGYSPYPASARQVPGATAALVRGPQGKRLFLSSPVPGFSGEELSAGGRLCPLSWPNARALGRLLPEFRPRRLPSGPSFGFGDRVGLAAPGHLRALAGAQVFPVLAQQSVRENTRTGRTFDDVLAAAVFGAFQEGYSGGFAADADHLKSVEDAACAARLGYTFFTCDPSSHIVAAADRFSDEELARRFADLPQAAEYRKAFLGKDISVDGLGRLRFSERDLARAAVKYGRAVEFAASMWAALADLLPGGFDYEVSVDETDSPTTPLEHFFIVGELQRRGVELSCLAPRFGGAMEKGVDFRGSVEVFRRDLRAHMAIAKVMGGYRISLHSGSDKFSLYPVFHQEGGGRWHVKTAGTSYLVALRVVAERSPDLFREIAALSLANFSEERATYHLSADRGRVVPPTDLPDGELPRLLEQEDSRQVLHVAFGAVLTSPLGEKLRAVLEAHEEEHYAALARHLGRHLQALGVKA
ncbi:MAG: tagaturonate epimerase family protein [Candidatus Bipolaricaulaceae bacterium]